MARTASAVAAYCKEANTFEIEEILLVGTNAVREARNQRVFLDRITEVAGQPLRVLSGDEEAQLSFLGTCYGLRPPQGRWVLLDIGGGSTECLLADADTRRNAVSLQLGAVTLTETYLTQDPTDWAEYAALAAHIKRVLVGSVPRDFLNQPVSWVLGTAGTVTTLAALDQQLETYDPERVQGYGLKRHRIEQQLTKLGNLPISRRTQSPCLETGRADIIIAGIAVSLGVLELFNVGYLIVSDYGLREGILVEHLHLTR
jgi:exopolyphosphatase/guanosine-5'-triphosphate,3'-diphosphate pyrophosphatase